MINVFAERNGGIAGVTLRNIELTIDASSEQPGNMICAPQALTCVR